jgi:hypothetical protein
MSAPAAGMPEKLAAARTFDEKQEGKSEWASKRS